MKQHQDDILENCLNFGVKFAAQKHNVSIENVCEILASFHAENQTGMCDCICHIKGKSLLHFGPCCEFTYTQYINNDGTIDLEIFKKCWYDFLLSNSQK